MMTDRVKPYLFALFVGLAGLGGCSPLAPRPDRTEYYILTPLGDGDSAPPVQQTTTDLSVGVGPIKFPGYLKRAEVVTRSTPNKLQVSDQKRWGEPLDKNFERVLAQNLAQILGTQRIITYPWYPTTHVDLQVEVQVERFETSANGQSQLTATWTIRSGQDGHELYTNRTFASVPVDKSDGGASAALSGDLASLSRDIAAQISILRSQPDKRAKSSGAT
jgi:uncharacterized lipoprotein YmbA